MRQWTGLSRLLATLCALCVLASARPRVAAQLSTPPLIVVDTSKGTFAFETYPNEAPRTVNHIVGLVRSGFYNGQRIHRALPGFVVQFGDPQTRDPATRELWGRGVAASSGTPIGVSEVSPRRRHQAGAVGISHMGDPAKADSQLYVTLAPRPDLDGQYTIFAQVVEGEDVPARLQVGDQVRRVFVRE